MQRTVCVTEGQNKHPVNNGSCNDLMPNVWQTIIWTNSDFDKEDMRIYEKARVPNL